MKFRFFVVVIFLLLPVFLSAQEFPVVSARARGMGGAFVAVADDASAAYWNPAAITLSQMIDIQFDFSARSAQTADFLSVLDDIIELNVLKNPDKATEFESLLQKALADEPFMFGGSQYGIFYTNDLFSAAYYRTSRVFADVSLDFSNLNQTSGSSDSVLNNSSSLNHTRVVTQEYLMGFGYPLAGINSSIGATAKYVTASVYRKSSNLISDYTESYNEIDFALENFKDDGTDDTYFSVDVGGLMHLSRGFSVGIVGRDVFSPEIEISGGENLKVSAQWRAGFMLRLSDWLIAAGDYDISKNRYYAQGPEFQQLALGFEATLWQNKLFVRVGGNKNIAFDDSPLVFTGGLGLRVDQVVLDVSGSYAPDREDLSLGIQLHIVYL